MDNLAFKIQLGVILPQLEEKMSAATLEIFDNLLGFVQAGEVEGGEINVDEVKEILVKDFEIFLDKKVIPQSGKLQKSLDEEQSESDEEPKLEEE